MALKWTLVISVAIAVVYGKPADVALPPVQQPSIAVADAAPVGVAHVPAQVGTAISKTVHYAETPTITGYMSTLYKPDLSPFDSPMKFNHQQRYLRPIKTLLPKLVPIEPKVPVAVPVVPATRDIEFHPPILPEVRIANPFAAVYMPPVIAPLVR